MIFLGLDIETTGTNTKTDLPLEIYCAAYDKDFDEPLAEFHAVIQHPDLPLMDKFVLDMHTKNGLWREITEKGEEERAVLVRFRAFLEEFPGAFFFGRNVGTFDRALLENRLPGLTSQQHYRNFDLSTLLTLFKIYPTSEGPLLPQFATDHRAKGDVLGDVETMREIIDWLVGL